MNSTTDSTDCRPGDHLQLTWLDPAGAPLGTDHFTITAHPGDPDHELWIHCPLLLHLGHAQPGDVITFDRAGVTTTVRIDTDTCENPP